MSLFKSTSLKWAFFIKKSGPLTHAGTFICNGILHKANGKHLYND